MRLIIKRDELNGPPQVWLPDEDPPASRPRSGAGPQARSGRQEADSCPVGTAPTGDLGSLEREARERGLAQGMAAAEEAYRSKLAGVEALAASLKAERAQFFGRIEPELVRLSVSIAEKITGRELELRPEIVVDVVCSAMKRLRDRESLRVSVSPQDAERVKEARDDLISAVDGVRRMEIVEDRRVDIGGCVIESPGGTLDARIRAQLDEIGRALSEMLPEQQETGEGVAHPESSKQEQASGRSKPLPTSRGSEESNPGPEPVPESGQPH